MHPYHEQGIKWTAWLAGLSDEELVEAHNASVGMRCYSYARQKYLSCLCQELLERDFDSSIIIDLNRNGVAKSYCLAMRVRIVDGDYGRVLIPTYHA